MKKLICAVTVLAVSTAQGAIINVPGDEPTIQAGIDAAVDGDEVVVAPGTYLESIDFLGKAIWLRSSAGAELTMIDGTGNFHVVACGSGEGPDTVLSGFTITGGNANGSPPDDDGGGMFNYNGSSPTVTNCTFSDNSASFFGGGMRNANSSSPTVTNCTFTGNEAGLIGGGMHNGSSSPTVTNCTFTGNSAVFNAGGMSNFANSSPTVTNCTFSGNSASSSGGGMRNANASSPTVTNCTFSGNSASSSGGGMYNDNASSPTVINCTFSGNSAVTDGGGMWNGSTSSPTVANCILRNNSPDEIFGPATVAYSDVQGGYPGIGNIDADPLFVDPDNGDFRLQAGSPCIDAGDNASMPNGVLRDLDGNPRFIDSTFVGTMATVDMGAYEYQRSVGGGRAIGDGPWQRDMLTLLGWNALPGLD